MPAQQVTSPPSSLGCPQRCSLARKYILLLATKEKDFPFSNQEIFATKLYKLKNVWWTKYNISKSPECKTRKDHCQVAKGEKIWTELDLGQSSLRPVLLALSSTALIIFAPGKINIQSKHIFGTEVLFPKFLSVSILSITDRTTVASRTKGHHKFTQWDLNCT